MNNGSDVSLGLELLMNPKKRSSHESISDLSVHSRPQSHSHSHSDVVDVGMDTSGVKAVRTDYFESDKDDTHSEVSVRYTKPSPAVMMNNSPYDHRGQESPSEKSFSSISSIQFDRGNGQRNVTENPRMSQEELLTAKMELLYQFDRLEKKGIKVPRKFTTASSLEEMKAEFERLKKDREVDVSVKFQRRMLMTLTTGVEFMNNKFDPFDLKLDGWSESINDNIADYDEVFEELHEKYKGKAKMPAELKLMFMVGGSAFMFHLTNTMFKSSLPGLDQVMKQNPELMKQFASATMNTMSNQDPKFGSGLGGIIGSLFGGGGGGGGMGMQMPPPQFSNDHVNVSRPQMRGPTNVDDILRELDSKQPNNERIEIVSTMSDSDVTDIPDDASMSGIFSKKKKTRRTLNI
jgi:hypothetical protein